MPLERCDLLVHSGVVVDGTGAPRFAADVAVDGDRIVAIGDLDGVRADRRVDASGLVVAPGFVDAHTHDDRLVMSSPDMTCKVSQGVTTVVTGNCGISLAPMAGKAPPPPMNLLGGAEWFRYPTLGEYFEAVEAAPPAINLAPLVGHTALRACTMDDLFRPASAAEIDRMERLLDEALEAGCVGMSSGLAYPPANAAPAAEVTALAHRLAAHGAIYTTHMRDEGAGVVDSVRETIAVAEATGVPVVISHHKCSGRENWGLVDETLPLIRRARERVRVALDVYPYTASSTVLMADWVPRAERVLVTWSVPHPECAARDLAELARDWECTLDAAVDRLSPAGAIYFQMDETDLRKILAFEDAMIGSDGLPHDEHPHPRLWGAFPRVLGHYCREVGLLGLEEGVRRMTGVTAETFGLTDRGVVRAGAFADLVVFDAATILDRADFAQPKQPAAGIHHVVVNGEPAWSGHESTGSRSGRVLRRG